MKIRNTAILLIHCPDKEGIVAAVTDFLFKNRGNILDLEQHVDTDMKTFFMRVEWSLDNFNLNFGLNQEFILKIYSYIINSKYKA